ncbi:MAG: PEP-CTERM system TPR-repeat protein PrsT [Burkholderiaceae bacterium]|nr:MAG: PEP-CTERM system TPR-repeat protein PrsT [Burkholderiaceae bacterium]
MTFGKSNRPMTVVALLVALLLAACSQKPEAMIVSAKQYLAKNDRKAAVIQIKNALQSNPNLPEARFLLGSTLLESGDPVGAETELRKALDLKYPQTAVIPPLAQSMLAQGQAKKVIDEFSGTELGTPQAKANLQMTLASAYAIQGKPDLSATALNAALSAAPGYVPALVAKAGDKASHGDFDGALTMLADVIAKSPQSAEAWKLKGDILLLGKNQAAEAVAAYRKSVEIKPELLAGHAALITALLRQGNITDADKQLESLKKLAPNQPQTKYLEAQMAFEKKDFKSARDLTQQLVAASPSNVQVLQLAGAVELQLNTLPAAQDYLSRALRAAPNLALARRLLVVTYLRAGQTAKAMTTLLPALKPDTTDPELLSVAGDVYLQSGDLKQAQDYFERAARQAPKDGKKQTAVALTHLMQGDTNTAFAELQNIAVSDPGTTADLALISAHLKRQEYDKALKAIDGLEKKQPDKPLASLLRGRTLQAMQDPAGARKSFERALTIDPNYFPAVASLAALDVAANKPEDAKKRFQAVLEKNPKSGQAWVALAELAAKSGAKPDEVAKLLGSAVTVDPTQPTPRLLLIDFYLNNKEFKQASSAAQDAVAAMPDNPAVLDALGRTQQAAGDLNQALVTFDKLADMQPMSPQPFMRLAGVHMAEKNKDAAAQSLEKALQVKPDLLEAQRALVALELDGKKVPAALDVARTVQKQRPREAIGYLLDGDINASQKNWSGAAAAYRAGLKQVNAPELAVKLHAVLLASGQAAEADRFSSMWQKDNPKDAAFPFYLGDQALARKDYAGASRQFAAVIKLQPNNASAYNNLAWVSAKLNKDGAVGYAEKANALAPNQPAFMDTLAMVLADKGDYAKALELQNKALALQPQNNEFKLNLAKINIKAGNKDLARKELQDLGKLGDAFTAQAEVTSLLKGL